MVELRPGIPTQSLIQQFPGIRQSLANSGTAMTWQDGQRYYLLAVEGLGSVFGHHFVDGSWHDRLYSNGYWRIREMDDGTTRPIPLLTAEANRLVRWLEDMERELKRISEQDEWDDQSIPRLVLDTSALVREGSFDSFDWSKLASSTSVRLIVPILVVRELDDLKNYAKTPKARPRLRKMMGLLDGQGRGPASISGGTTLELLMDPPGHSRLTSHDEEIVRRAAYLQGRKGGPLRLITGDYTMLFTAQAEGVPAELTPGELVAPDDESDAEGPGGGQPKA